jgi:hypothetical protein
MGDRWAAIPEYRHNESVGSCLRGAKASAVCHLLQLPKGWLASLTEAMAVMATIQLLIANR